MTDETSIESSPGTPTLGRLEQGTWVMATNQGYFNDLNRLLAAMPAGMLDMDQIDANERHHGHQFYDPPETVYQWLLDQQRRTQAKPGQSCGSTCLHYRCHTQGRRCFRDGGLIPGNGMA